MKRSIMMLIWLVLLGQLSWGQTDCGVSVAFHSPEPDTLVVSDKWFARDKAEHLVVSAFLSGVSYSVLRDFYHNREGPSACFSGLLTLGAGVGKELYDLKTPGTRFSYKDIIADALGIALGLWIATR